MENVKIDQELDCKGLTCPLPVIKTKQAIDNMAIGQVLKMVATDPGSIRDIQAWSKRTGHNLLESRQQDSLYLFLIQKAK
ncbi:MAG: sulfurtransferase TusA family protein [Nitrospira sp.]|nr:sulfurtransferase TusA family protein [Nitrospira sp.]